MTNEKLTEIVTIIDRSGSMMAIKDDMTGGLKRFIAEQAKLPDPAVLSIYTFDDKFETFCEEAPLGKVEEFELEPRGMTALLDAMGKTIVSVGERLRAKAENDRPGKVVIIVITDGAENASTEYGLTQISEMVKHQTEKYNWQFAFLGANIDSFSVGAKLGVARNSTMDYMPSAAGTKAMYSSLSRGMSTYRSAGSDAELCLQPADDTKDEV